MNINVIKEFKIGSSIFFASYSDYTQKDIDILAITDLPLFGKPMMNMKLKDKDIFFMCIEDNSVMLDKTLESGINMRAGKFLSPEFAEYIGLTIEELKKLKPMFDDIDEKHMYEKVIFDSYIKNNGFFLTNEQRLMAYEEYKRKRPERYQTNY